MFALLYPVAAQHTNHEVRAVWLTTADNLDWPKVRDIGNPEAQKRDLVNMLDRLQELNFNTVYFQVRSRGNAFYNSSYEPWARELSGKLGVDPGWDPLKFIIDECNKRGMELHAWINIIKVWSGVNIPPETVNKHLLRSHPKWCSLYEREWWIDLGYPDARKYTIDVVKDILSKYDIDGLHFDYLRYPGRDFDDDESYKQFGAKTNKNDWRRNNINLFLSEINKFANETKPYVKIGAAPIGIYKNIPGINGWSSYDNLFQDSKYWVDKALVDYITPQTYWDTKQTRLDPPFETIIKEWRKLSPKGNIYPGIGFWKKNISSEIETQIDLIRGNGMNGFAFYRAEHVLESVKIKNIFRQPAQIPQIKVSSNNFSAKDIILEAEPKNDLINLKWKSIGNNIKFFNIYLMEGEKAKLVRKTGKNIFEALMPQNSGGYAISFTDRYDRESPLYHQVKTTVIASKEKKIVTEKNDSIIINKNLYELKNEIFQSNIVIACYPNPFDEYLLIGYEIPHKSQVEVSITTVDGIELLKLLKGLQNPGKYILKADGYKFEKGRYICRVRAGDITKQKIIIKK